MKDEASRNRPVRQAAWFSSARIRCCRILEVAPEASLEEIRDAHKDLVKVWHPDRFADDPRLQQKAQEKLKEINEAYEQLLEELAAADREALAPGPRPPGPWASGLQGNAKIKRGVPGPPPVTSRHPFVNKVFFRRYPPLHVALALGALAIAALVAFGFMFNDDLRRDSSVQGPVEEHFVRGPNQSAGYFALGSSQDQVLAVQGTPTSVEGNRWMYELSSVSFQDGKVESYANVSRNLRVRLTPKSDPTAARARGYFTLGSAPDEVLAVQGTPVTVEGQRWRYDSSSLEFASGKVANYSDFSHNLRVQVYPAGDASAARSRGYFTLGSSSDEVLAVQGTPTSIEDSRWRYDSSLIEFVNGKVGSFSNGARNLRVQMYPAIDASAARARGYFTMGSSPDEVLAVQGTPTSIDDDRWSYDLSWVRFKDGKVESYANISNNLKLRLH